VESRPTKEKNDTSAKWDGKQQEGRGKSRCVGGLNMIKVLYKQCIKTGKRNSKNGLKGG
jgi:hypothetical protein